MTATRKPTGTINYFVRLDRDLVRGEVFAHLSCKATRLLIGLLDRFNGRNNGNIHYSIPEAMIWLHCSRCSAIRAFQELREAGLVERTRKGAFAGAGKGTANTWRLTFL